MGRRKSAAGPPKANWMTTFSDLVTLLLTFFVLLLTMSSMDNKKLKDLCGFFNGTVGPLSAAEGRDVAMDTLLRPPVLMPNALDALYGAEPAPVMSFRQDTIEDLLERAARRSIESDLVEVEKIDNGVTLRLAGDAAFSPDGTGLTAEARQLVLDAADLAATAGLSVEVATHVAPVRRHVESAWYRATLLGDRAARLVERVGGVAPSRISLRAYGRASERPVAGHPTTLSVALITPDDAVYDTMPDTASDTLEDPEEESPHGE